MFCDNVLVVLQKLVVTLLSFFEVSEKDGPVIVEVRLQAAHILEVHIRINILWSGFDLLKLSLQTLSLQLYNPYLYLSKATLGRGK